MDWTGVVLVVADHWTVLGVQWQTPSVLLDPAKRDYVPRARQMVAVKVAQTVPNSV